MSKIRVYLIALGFLVSANIAGGAEFIELGTSVRALGMGNAYSAIVNDSDSLFYNMAGLGRVHGINWRIFDAGFGVDGADVVQTVQAMQSSTDFAQALRNFYGKHIWVGFGGKTALTINGWGIAAYEHGDVSMGLSNPALPVADISLINDLGVATGFAFQLMPGVYWGFGGKRITRIGSNIPIGIETLFALNNSAFTNSLNNMGTGYAFDTGFQFVFPTPVSPTFSFAWKNLGQTRFTKDSGSNAPPVQQDEMIVGFGMTFDATIIKITPAFDYKYLNRYDEQIGKKLHMGIEVSIPLFDFRAGLSQGYYTLGAGINLGGILRLDAATYGVERGVYPGQDEDRRYIVQAVLELGMDPSFGFLKGGSGAGGRAPKQRR